MGTGKLYAAGDGKFIANVNYQLQMASATSWWGELSLIEFSRLTDGGAYILELEDKGKGKCYLKKRVNRAVSGVPPRYIYHFTGTSPLTKPPK